MDTSLLLKGLLIGFSIAAPVGPIGVLCIRRTLVQGRAAGLVSGLGAASADAVYGSIAAFGLSFVSGLLISQQSWLKLIGGAFLCYLGIRTLLAQPAERAAAAGGMGLGGRVYVNFLSDADQPNHDPFIRGGVRRTGAGKHGRRLCSGGDAGAGRIRRLGAVVAAAERRCRAVPRALRRPCDALGQPDLRRGNHGVWPAGARESGGVTSDE